jgi:hypothetical protein
MRIIRSIVAIVVGLLAGIFVLAAIELAAMPFHPLPADIDLSDQEALKAHVARAPFAAQLLVASAWVLGAFVGGWLAAFIARRAYFAHGFTVGCVMEAATVLNLRTFQHPQWMVMTGVLGPILASWIGSALAEWMSPAKPKTPAPCDMRKKNMAC